MVRLADPEPLHSSAVPEPLRPAAKDLVVARYAVGWGYGAVEWEQALARIDWTPPPGAASRGASEDRPRLLKERADGNAAVWSVALDFGKRNTRVRRRAVVLKVERLNDGWAVAKSLLRLTKAHRQWRGAKRLEHAGIRAAQGVAIVRGRCEADAFEMLALEMMPGRTLLEHLADREITLCKQHRLARVVGRHLAKLCLAGLVNRDSKPSNLMIEWNERGKPCLTVLDTVAIDRRLFGRKPFWIEEGLARMARDLLLEPAGCGFPVRRTLSMRALQACFDRLHPDAGPRRWRSWREVRWRQVEAMIEAHGDPTPNDTPMILKSVESNTTTSPDRKGGVSR